MRNVWRVFTRDLRRLGKVPLAWVIIGGALITPSLYAWFNIAAFWNPFDNTKNLSIAVVNLDEGGSTSLTGPLNVGDQLVAQLKDNDDLGWHFLSEEEAMQSVKSGESYAAFVVPADFTEHLLSITTGDFTQPKLQYYVNEKANGVAPEITDVGATTVQTQMEDAFTAQVTTAVTTALNGGGSTAEEVLGSAQTRALNDLTKAADTIGETRTHLEELVGGLETSRTQLATADSTISRVDQTLRNVQTTLGEAQTLADQAQSKLLSLTSAVTTAYADSAAKLAQAAAKADTAVSKFEQGIDQTQAHIATAITSTETALVATTDALVALQAIDQSGLDPLIADQINDAIALLQTLDTDGETLVDDLQAMSNSLSDLGTEVQAAATAADTAFTNAAQAAQSINSAVSSSVPALQQAIVKLSGTTQALSASIDAQRVILGEARSLLSGLDTQLEKTEAVITSFDGNLESVENDLIVASTDVQALSSAIIWQQLDTLTSLDAQQISDFMSTPVVVKQHTIFPTAAYGSLMGSLFINLSLWIGAFVLVVIMKIEVDKEGIPDLTERQGYMGRWLLFAMISVAQAIVLSIGNIMIGVQHVNAFAFVATPVLIGLAYLSIIYALSVTFGYIGKGLCVVLVIMQIPGASGIYPIEMMPQFFQSLYPFFPFTYGIDMMREVVSGFAGFAYLKYFAFLLIFVVLAFLLGLVFRGKVSNLTRLFTREVGDTELFTNETGAPSGQGYRLNHLLRALADRAQYQKHLAKRALPFAKSYKKVRGAVVAIGILGMILLFALSSIFPDQKTAFVGWWVLLLVVVFAALVTLEYIRYSLRLSTEVSNMPEQELRKELKDLEARR